MSRDHPFQGFEWTEEVLQGSQSSEIRKRIGSIQVEDTWQQEGTSVLQVPEVSEVSEGLVQRDSRNSETRSPKNVQKSIAESLGRRPRFRHTGHQDFGNPEDERSGLFQRKNSKMIRAVDLRSGS